jgi:hypothetical protein
MNRRHFPGCILVSLCLLAASPGHGQKATEIYIPIGASPGVSVSKSFLGTVSRVDYDTNSIEIETTGGKRSVRVNYETLYYLDRSHYGKKNATGTMRDCEVGRRVEVYSVDGSDALWLKIETD